MKKQLLIILIAIISTNSFAQISFEKGYFINNNDQKIECFIKNIDWKNNPTEFEYRLSENEETKIASIKSIKEFGILEISKYNRFTVEIDRSNDNINLMSTFKDLEYKEEQLFLKVLVEGNANLYYYEDGSLNRFFFKTDTSNIKQLIYKYYRAPEDPNIIRINDNYKRQLWNNLKCQSISMKNVENIDYEKNDLVDFFIKYNKCIDPEYIEYEKKQKKDLFNLNIRPGLNSSSLATQNYLLNSKDIDFDNEFGFRFGIEAEFIMPFNKNKWAFIIEPTYHYYKSETNIRLYPSSEVLFTTQTVNVDYTSLELPIGIRHYMFLNNDSKIFINASLIFDFSLNSKIDFEKSLDLDVYTKNNLAFGVGYKNNKYSFELRYHTARDILGSYDYWRSDYNTLSVIFGYSIF